MDVGFDILPYFQFKYSPLVPTLGCTYLTFAANLGWEVFHQTQKLKVKWFNSKNLFPTVVTSGSPKVPPPLGDDPHPGLNRNIGNSMVVFGRPPPPNLPVQPEGHGQ